MSNETLLGDDTHAWSDGTPNVPTPAIIQPIRRLSQPVKVALMEQLI
jgi:hypothetical protein